MCSFLLPSFANPLLLDPSSLVRGPSSRGDPEDGARLAFPRLRSQCRRGRFGNRPPTRAANEGSRSGREMRRGNERSVLMAEAGREASGRGRTGSPLPGRFGRTKPTVGSRGGTTACAPAAPAQGSRLGHFARRCRDTLGQHKSFCCKALGRVVPLSRGCGIGTVRQRSHLARGCGKLRMAGRYDAQ